LRLRKISYKEYENHRPPTSPPLWEKTARRYMNGNLTRLQTNTDLLMAIPLFIEKQFHRIVNFVYAYIPQPDPDKDRLKSCRIISHRGEHDNSQILENTIQAFDLVMDLGVWGIEFDVRWTKDLYPVVFHDSDLKRLYGASVEIRNMELRELKDRFPLIPTLDEVVSRYGEKLHMMIELKEEIYPAPLQQAGLLRKILSSLTPEIDFHFLSLTPGIFRHIHFVPAATFIPVAELNVADVSDLAANREYGGISGHFLFIKNSRIKIHHQSRQVVGTGFISSRNGLFRELNRGVDWIFSNDAVRIQAICNNA